MYFSVKYIDVKLNQDYADFTESKNKKSLILCDGIGEFKDSGIAAKLVVEQFIMKGYSMLSELLEDNKLHDLKAPNFVGGTTFICATNKKQTNKIKLEYLGNGGIIHFHGDYAKNTNTTEPYRYGELMIPHISPNGALTKHISHNSGKIEFASTKIDINLNYITGDILLLFSDGISSLEDKVILKDDQNRFWRNENPAIQLILIELDSFLKLNNKVENFKERLIEFNNNILLKLKKEDYLEDDASLGIIITDNVLNHYQEKLND